MERLGHFELKELIGAGGMARVYRALDTRLGREVAIKLLDPGLASRPGAADRFQREARLAAGLRHPNVVAVHDCSPEGSPHWYLVTELVEGGSLRARIAQGPLLAEEAALLLLPVARALGAAHRHGIIHRDVKPDNILVDSEHGATIKLADFGVAVALFEPRVTSDGAISGSLAYMAPELLRGEPVTAAADVWSFGVTFFELAHGRLPFADLLLLAVGEGTVAVDGSLVPPPLSGLTKDCLQRDPRQRPANGAELAARLESALARCGLEHPDQELAQWAREPDHSQRLRQRVADWLVGAAVEAPLPARADLLDRALALIPGHPGALGLLGGASTTGALGRPFAPSRGFAPPPTPSNPRGSLAAAPEGAVRPPRPRRAMIAVLLGTLACVGLAVWLWSRRGPSSDAPAIGVTGVTVRPDGSARPDSVRRRDSGARPDAASPRLPRRALRPGDPSRREGERALATPGTLQLTTEPWAEVILDGRSLGHTPRLHRIELPAGERRLRLRNPLCRPEELQVKVRSGELIVRHVRLEVLPARATLRGPAGWVVYLEGRKLGVLPLPIVNVEHGDHTVLIVGPSGQSLKRRFRATAGESLTVELLEGR